MAAAMAKYRNGGENTMAASVNNSNHGNAYLQNHRNQSAAIFSSRGGVAPAYQLGVAG